MIAPCSSGFIREPKQRERENRIETNDFFPATALLQIVY